METLDCIYGGSIIYQYLPPDDLGGINGLYSSQYLAQRDTNFLRIYTATTHDGSEMLYKLYSSAIRQHCWPELVDVRDTTATWLVTCPGPHHDSALTVARTLVALDARWSIVGLLSFGEFGIVLKGRLTDAQVVSLERWEFPAGLLRIGNPTALFRGKASSNVGPSTELEGHSNSSNLATASAVAEARIINDSASEISRGVIEGPSLSNDDNNIADSSSSTSWPQPQIPPFADDGYATSDDDDSDSDTLSSNFSSDEDEEQLPSYRHASRRLARERRLLAQDPSEFEDPAGAAISCRDVVGEGEEGDSDVPPTYHDRGEGAPDYVELTGSEEAPAYTHVAGNQDRSRDEAPTDDPQAPPIHLQESPPSYPFLPVISEEILPDYESIIELDTLNTTATSTYFRHRQDDSNSSHSSTATLRGSLQDIASSPLALEPSRTPNLTHRYGPSMASDILPTHPSSSPPTYQPRLARFSSPSPLSPPQNQIQAQNSPPPPAPSSPTAPNTTTPVPLPGPESSPPAPPPQPHSIHYPPAHSLSMRTIRTPASDPFPPAPDQRAVFDFGDLGSWPALRLLPLPLQLPLAIPPPPHPTPTPSLPMISTRTTYPRAYGGSITSIPMPAFVSIRSPTENTPLASSSTVPSTVASGSSQGAAPLRTHRGRITGPAGRATSPGAVVLGAGTGTGTEMGDIPATMHAQLPGAGTRARVGLPRARQAVFPAGPGPAPGPVAILAAVPAPVAVSIAGVSNRCADPASTAHVARMGTPDASASD